MSLSAPWVSTPTPTPAPAPLSPSDQENTDVCCPFARFPPKLRSMCHCLYQVVTQRFQQSSAEAVWTVIGTVIFLRFINPAIGITWVARCSTRLCSTSCVRFPCPFFSALFWGFVLSSAQLHTCFEIVWYKKGLSWLTMVGTVAELFLWFAGDGWGVEYM